jgi:hypothetical protein
MQEIYKAKIGRVVDLVSGPVISLRGPRYQISVAEYLNYFATILNCDLLG